MSMKQIKSRDMTNIAAKRMYYIFLVGVIPLLLIFLLYANNQGSDFLNYLYTLSGKVPELISASNPLLSGVMSFYVKIAPLLGVLFFLIARRELNLKTTFSFTKGILAFMLFTVFYIAIVYYLLVCNVELTESGRFMRLLSGNDYLLTIFFVSVFYVCYILTCYYISYAYAVFLILKLKIKHR